ncbi:hypothetical protein FJY71_04935, partial [candidate division WOR-3 bacterium]|nr:hypothetical protein [candidate division WOR-3 bacterium]
MHAPRPIRALLAAVLLAGTAAAGWLDVESITNRADTSDLTCENNARAVVCDPFGRIHVVWRGEVDEALQVWYMRCPQDSTRWRDTTILSSDTAHASGPCLALDSFGDLHVAWTSGESLRVATRDSV